VEGGLERFESGDLLRKEKTSVPFRDHDPSGRGRSGEEHMDVNIISSPTVTVTGHISNKPATEKHYFTAFTVATATESIRIGFESLGGIAHASLFSSNAEQLTCVSATKSCLGCVQRQ
jgi:hypothetical protein